MDVITKRQKRITRKLETVFERPQAAVLGEVITDAYNDLVKADDFNELKAIVRDLAQAQNRTERRMEELAQAQNRTEQRMEELAQAQNRTEQRMEELAQAQNRTERRVEELAEAQSRTEQRMEELAQAQKETQQEIQTLSKRMRELGATVGGIGNTMGYALENEAYRMLPKLLQEKYGLEVTERFIRTDVNGQEINILGKARRNGEELWIVGESKSRLEKPSRKKKKGKGRPKDIWEQLAEKVETVSQAYPDAKIIPLIVTHYARPSVVQQAEKDGILIVQSFEW